MAVYYKFKSARDYDSIPMDGPFISVGTLKEKIFESKHLGRGKDFDLVVTNAQTNEEYLDEAMLIPKNTSVLIRRVPGRPRLPIVTQQEPVIENKVEDSQPDKNDLASVESSGVKFPEEFEFDEFGNDLYSIPEMPPVQSSNNITDAPPANIVDEDSKIKALIDTPALDWQRQGSDGFGAGRGLGRGMAGRMGGRGFGRMGLERKTPPPGYVCHRCKIPGHFIQHCPTNGDPNYDIKKVKPPTGIPKSMLLANPDGSYALPSGAVAVLKPNEAAFEKEIEGLPSTRSVGELPRELRCPLCNEVMKDAVLTSKCCFKSFCDKCIRDYIISKAMCVCGATDILADDLLPNKTLRDTINRILESGTSSAENAGSTFQVQDMESARCPPPKMQSPSNSAASKGEQKVVPPSNEGPCDKPTAELTKVASNAQPTTENVKTGNRVDASEATHDSVSVKEATSQGSAPVPDEEVQQKAPAELGKKKKKKKSRMPANDMQWNASQDLAAGNYMMPMAGPSGFNPYWNGIQPGMDGFMGPYGASMPFMGYGPGPGPLDMSFGGIMPPAPFGPQSFIFPPIPPHRDLAELGMGMNMPPIPPPFSREEFEARKADLRRKRENERRSESREFSRDRDYGREASFDAPPMKPRPKPIPPTSSGDNHHHRPRPDRSSQERFGRDLEPPSHSSKRKSDHHHLDYYGSDQDRGHERARSHDHDHGRGRSRDRDHGRERSHDRDYDYNHRDRDRDRERDNRDHDRDRHRDHDRDRHCDHDRDRDRDHDQDRDRDHDRERDHHHHHRSESSSKTTAEPKASPMTSVSAADKKHKASVFSRISFPEEEPASKKRKVSSSSTEAGGGNFSASSAHHHSHKSEHHEAKISAPVAPSDRDYESSDDDRHFKRKPSRYEPSPPSVAAKWEDGEPPRHSKGSRDRERYSKHR